MGTTMLRPTVYIDDGRIISASKDQAELDRAFVYDTLAKAGWIIENSKSDGALEASQIKQYLGFEIDTASMLVHYPQPKLSKLITATLMNVNIDTINVKGLARILGRIAALLPSHGPLARVWTRSGYAAFESHVEANSWKGNVHIPEQFQYFPSISRDYQHWLASSLMNTCESKDAQ